jgi:peptide/nickel transport system ATP-binding protein
VTEDLVRLRGLRIQAGNRVLVDDVGLDLVSGRIVALVGASGSGKTLTARALLGMVDIRPGVVAADLEIHRNGEVIRPYDACLGRARRMRLRAFARVRGDIVGYLPQDARGSLDPMWRVGAQVHHTAVLRPGADPDPVPWFRRAGFHDPDRVATLYPHELSGGMAQRVSIALALARGSRFLLADEPTTGLDPTVQREILDEIRSLAREGIGILLITHDIRVLPGTADEVVVLHLGTVVERTDAATLRDGRLQSEPGRVLVEATRRVATGRMG